MNTLGADELRTIFLYAEAFKNLDVGVPAANKQQISNLGSLSMHGVDSGFQIQVEVIQVLVQFFLLHALFDHPAYCQRARILFLGA